jgi:type IV pilus assembly protein PilO
MNFLEEVQHLDPQNWGNWPISVKTIIIVFLCIVALLAGYWFDTKIQIEELNQAKQEENKLKKDFKKKQLQAATLPKLKEQLVEIEFLLEELFKKLPSDDQVDELIKEISQTVLASGLKQELFKPLYGKERLEKGLYMKLPITLRAKGNYHTFGKFVSGIAAMNRIVTQHNVSITSSKNKKRVENPLTLNMTIQIYRYLDKKARKKGKRRKRRRK